MSNEEGSCRNECCMRSYLGYMAQPSQMKLLLPEYVKASYAEQALVVFWEGLRCAFTT